MVLFLLFENIFLDRMNGCHAFCSVYIVGNCAGLDPLSTLEVHGFEVVPCVSMKSRHAINHNIESECKIHRAYFRNSLTDRSFMKLKSISFLSIQSELLSIAGRLWGAAEQ